MPETNTPPKLVCFIDMPFGNKTDPRTGIEIDFDRVYEQGIRPAVEGAGLQCVRGDRERTGGIIHTAMFARLLLSEFVIADLTSANPNVFYELGVRHAAKPRTTIPIFATIGDLPFDVNLIRAIPYSLDRGQLTEAAAGALREALQSRIHNSLQDPVTRDSPLFELFDRFPGIEMSHEITDVFRDRVRYSQELRDRLEDARCAESRDLALAQIRAIEEGLGDLQTVERGVLVDLFLSYRDVEGWDEMIALYQRLPADLREAVVARQQYALAVNRRGGPGDSRRATRELERILDDFGESAETWGLLGRIYKDQYRSTAEGDGITRSGYLDRAIEAYTKGFECEPMDYYPGVNAITLLMQKGTPEATREAARLVPLVTFAAVRQGGAESSDYWTVATVLELAFNGRDHALAERVLPRLLAMDAKPWMLRTTADNLQLLMDLRKAGEDVGSLEKAVTALREQADRRENQTL